MSATASRRRRVACLALLALLTAACGQIVDLSVDEPLSFVEQPRTSRILAPDGTVLADLHGTEDRDEVPLDAIDEQLVAAVIATEDRRFFVHAGVDLASLGRAAVRNLEAGEVDQGGSTLTQQLVKTTMTGPARTLDRKLEEALLAMRLERSHDKEHILASYLNTVYFGRGAYGVAAAARRFFDRGPGRLTLAQSALLAGVLASPARYDPWEEPAAARARRSHVLDALLDTGAIDAGQARRAKGAPLGVVDDVGASDPGAAPWIASEVRRLLQNDPEGRFAAALGDTVEQRSETLFSGGLRVVTTVDLDAQQAAERALAARLPEDGPSGALAALDPATGAVRALVGGRATDAATGLNLATQGRRSPGSAFKPLVLATALARGVPLDRDFPGGACVVFEEIPGWQDEGACNYGDTDHGPLTLREATVRSVNTVYARLAVELGPSVLVDGARQLGITSELNEAHAVALGSEAVSPLELAAAYSSFATLGTRAEPYLVERIETADGELLYRHEPSTRRVLDEQVAWLVTDTLSDVVARGTGVRASIDRPQAGKTGTSQDNADAWFVGYTPELVASVWIGFPEGSVPLRPPTVDEVVEGGRWPADVWADFAEAALADTPSTAFPQPRVDVVRVEVDTSRNCLPNPYTPPDLIEAREFLAGTEPTQRCTEPTGPTLQDVPDVVGLPIEVASRLLEDRGYELEVRERHSAIFPPGVVVSQEPERGEDLRIGDEVVVWRSVASRERREPPGVLGQPLEEAIATLEDAGFVVEVRRECPCSQPPGTVHGQRPGPGVATLLHDVVTITAVPAETADTG